MPAHCLPAVMISIVFWKLRKCRFCHHLLVPCFGQPPLVAAEMLSLPLAAFAGRLIPWVFLLWVICDTSRAKLRRCGNLHLWRYPWTSRQEMVHSNEWSETVQIRSYITLYNIMCISTNIRRPLGKGERAWELWCQMRSNGASNLWIAWFGHETCWGSRSAKGFGSPFSS